MKLLCVLLLLARCGADDTDTPAAPPGSSYATDDPPCYFPTDWLAVPVRAVRQETADSRVITFGLPDGISLSLPVSSCILMKATGAGKDGKDVIKPYNPISSNLVTGSFDLLVKVYPNGQASSWAGRLDVGDAVSFKQVKGNVKAFRYPFKGISRITMLAGGTGVAPMIQALHPLLETPGETTKVRLIYGNKSVNDILLKDELDAWAREYPDRLKIVHVVGTSPDAPAPAGWADTDTYTAATGWIDAAKLEQHAFAPSDDTMLFVCGLPAMYDSLCGPRNEKEVAQGTVLQQMGYDASMVAKM